VSPTGYISRVIVQREISAWCVRARARKLRREGLSAIPRRFPSSSSRAGILDVVNPLLTQRSTQEALSLRPLLFSESTKARLGMFFVARGIKVAKRRAAEYIFRDT